MYTVYVTCTNSINKHLINKKDVLYYSFYKVYPILKQEIVYNNWRAPHKKQASAHSLYDLHIKEAMALTLFCLHALLRKMLETVHTKTRQMTFTLFLCGRFRRAFCNNACIKVR